MDNKFEAGVFSERTEKIYKKLVKLYDQNEKHESAEQLKMKYEEIAQNNKISVVFAGQYSAGKSTIIRALTGDQSIKIDSDITTEKVHSYSWGDTLYLVDTPGLKTGEREEHDRLTLSAIECADLLMYCITSDLFSPITREDFKKLAQKYRSKIFLVVNKMNDESGDYDELVKNYTGSINKTLYPEFAISEFHHFFVDAKDYLKGITENDQDYIEDSYFDTFINKLNEFVEINGLKGKLLTPVILIIDTVDNTLIELEDDEHIKEAKRLLHKICNLIEEKKNAFVRLANQDVKRITNKYINKGDEVVMNLGNPGYEFSQKAFADFSEPLESELRETIEKMFQQYAEEVDDEVQEVLTSEMAKHFFNEQEKRIEKNYKGEKKNTILEGAKDTVAQIGANTTPKISKWIGQIANVSNGEKVSIWTVNGSDLHKVVKTVGHKIGHKFKPFEALKLTKKIAEISNYLGPILTGVGVFIEGMMWLAEKYGEKKLRETKAEIKAVFKEAADDTQKYYFDEIVSAAKEFENIKKSVMDELDRLEEKTVRNSEFGQELRSIKSELKILQEDIER